MSVSAVLASPATVAFGAGLPGTAQGASSSTEFIFKDAQATPAEVYCKLWAPKFNNTLLKIKAWGRVTGGTTETFVAALYFGTSTTIGSNNVIFTTSTHDVNSESGHWMIEANVLFDATIAKLQGTATGYVNDDTIVALVKLTELTAKDFSGEIGFNVTGKFSTTNASQSAVMDGFVIELA